MGPDISKILIREYDVNLEKSGCYNNIEINNGMEICYPPYIVGSVLTVFSRVVTEGDCLWIYSDLTGAWPL